jgi:hypothetical protein
MWTKHQFLPYNHIKKEKKEKKKLEKSGAIRIETFFFFFDKMRFT